MRRQKVVMVGAGLAALVVSVAATSIRPARPAEATRAAPAVTHEIIAVYLGATGTDAKSGMLSAVADMKTALLRQAKASDRRFVSRLVSLEPSVELGLRHAALFGAFDEVSLGGNWTNADVVRYLGPDMGSGVRRAGIPQVIVLERDVEQTDSTLHIGPEREISRLFGTKEIADWARAGAPLPK